MDDPFVEEVHEIRRKLLNECGGDLEKLMDRLKSREHGDASRIVSEIRSAEAGRGSSR